MLDEATNAAQSIADDADVRTRKLEDSDNWEVETVLITNSVGENKASEQTVVLTDDNNIPSV